MTDNVVNLPCVTTHNLPPRRVIDAAGNADLEGVVVLGWGKDGEPYFASSIADGGSILLLWELCKKKLFEMAEAP